MARAQLTEEMLRTLSRERDVIAYTAGVDERGIYVVVKFSLKNGDRAVVIMPTPVALNVRNRLRFEIRKRRMKSTAEQVDAFCAAQVALDESDWNGSNAHVRVASACEVHAYSNAVFLGYLIDRKASIWQAFRLYPSIAQPLVDYVTEFEKAGSLRNLSAGPKGGDSTSRH